MATKTKKKPVAKAKAKAKIKAKPKAAKKVLKPVKSKAKPVAVAKPMPRSKPTPQGKPTAGRSRAVMSLITPLEDRLIVRVADADEKTAGGLYIPHTAAERPNRGEVIAAGPGRRNKKGKLRPLDVNVGDSILFPQYSGAKIAVDEQEFLILREDEVLGVIE